MALLRFWPALTRTRWGRHLLVYCLAVGVLAGPAYPMYRHYDFSHSRDTLTYLQMARGEWQGTSITRRYRVVVPALAAVVAWPLQRIHTHLWPRQTTPDWPLRLAFFGVNTLLLAAAGLLWYRTARLYGASPAASALAMLAALSSRWAVYTAGLPLVDSLYLLVLALGFYAARSSSGRALVVCLLLGPVAKESFVFMVPWLLVFGRRALSWPRQVGALLVAGALTLALRTWVDAQAGSPPAASLHNALDHGHNVLTSVQRLASLKGLSEVFGVFGFFALALGLRPPRTWARPLGGAGAALLAVVGVHMLLSGDLARMAYLLAPAFTVALALVLDTVLPPAPAEPEIGKSPTTG